MTRMYAHRGASAERPENTLAAFRRALELGVDGIELDVHLSADGAPMVIHDETVDRTTNGLGRVADLTHKHLVRLDAGKGESIPTLAQVLQLVSGRLHVDIEVKVPEAADAVLAEVENHRGLDFAISSFDHRVLRHVRSVDSSVELWPLIGPLSDAAIETAVTLGSPQLAIHANMVNRDMLDYARSFGLGLWAWTVNDPARVRELAGMGVVGICTDDPKRMLQAIRNSVRS